jgi:hypothetical protein
MARGQTPMCTDARSRSRGGDDPDNRGIAGPERDASTRQALRSCAFRPSVARLSAQSTRFGRLEWNRPSAGRFFGAWRGDTAVGLFSDGRSGALSTRFRGKLPGYCAAYAIRTLAGSAFLPASCWFSEASSRSCRSSESGCCPSGSCSSRTTSRSCGSRSGGLRSGAYGNGRRCVGESIPLDACLEVARPTPTRRRGGVPAHQSRSGAPSGNRDR